MTGTKVQINLDDEQAAMLDAICLDAGGVRRVEMARRLLVAVLEDDAASHNATAGATDTEKVVVLRNWRGARER